MYFIIEEPRYKVHSQLPCKLQSGGRGIYPWHGRCSRPPEDRGVLPGRHVRHGGARGGENSVEETEACACWDGYLQETFRGRLPRAGEDQGSAARRDCHGRDLQFLRKIYHQL